MKVSLKKAFSIIDGRLSTPIEDVYKMLNYIYSTSIFTNQIPEAIRIIHEVKPDWYINGVNIINSIKVENNTDDFSTLIKIIDEKYSDFQIELSVINREIELLSGLHPEKTIIVKTT